MKTTLKFMLMATVAFGGVSASNTFADDDDKKPKKWSVTAPDFKAAKSEATIDTTEGTWMSLDVSPDGTQIAFDMLGDIYVMPISGGTPTNISSGLAWDMQPRWSPDGSKIAFTSDRAGGDNIWVMDANGENAKQITNESFRLMNNPTWSPDGTMIAAKKHFTTGRSLGTGEIWLYHLDGGKGVQVVKRPSEAFQKEIGEPVFAPDGNSIYYTMNVTGGNTFIYAQDTNKEIFNVRNVNLTTGEITKVAGGPGGATTAAPSPDGTKLAFIRRVRAQSRLFVRDLATGAEHMLVDSMDQDMQETWGVQGMYPNMAWTPDNKSVIFWALGKISRVDVATGEVSDVPFHIKDTRTVYEAMRFKTDVSPDAFDTKMVRWANSHGDSTVFESLGKLYLKRGDGAPTRLTKDKSGEFELYPSFSRDGKWIYFISWDDQKLATIRRVKAKGGKSEALTTQKGHYTNPQVSPDGKTVVFSKGSGGGLLAPFGTEPGIYRMPADGGAMTRVSKTGGNAHFGATSDRIYVTRFSGGQATLSSMNMNGNEMRDHAKSKFAREMKISPSGKHLAFVENYHGYVTHLPSTGKAHMVGPKASNLPIKRITSVGGTYINWAADGSAVNWSIGPDYKTAALSDVYGDDFKPVADGVSLSIKVATDKPSGTLAITGARIITMDADESVIENGVIIVEDNRIVAVGAAGDVEIPAGAKRMDASGKTIMPGIIDAHAHGGYAASGIVPQQNWTNYATLSFGVTTAHDPSNRATSVFAAAEYREAGLVVTPRLFSTAEIVYGAKSGSWAPVDKLDDAIAHIKRLKAQGAISAKNYNQPRRDQRQQVTEAARREGLNVVVEGGSLYHMDLNMVVDGNTGIEHTLPNQDIYDDVVQLWSQTNVGFTPTLGVGYGGVRGTSYWTDKTEVWKHPILSKYVPPKSLQAATVRREKSADSDYGHVANAALAKKLMDKGVDVNIGGHGEREGLAAHWEIWSFAQGGMSNMEALKTATSNPARYLGFDDDLGSLEVGKLADLVILDKNPLDDIQNTDDVSHVMINGRLYDSMTMNEVLTGDRKTRPFYWWGKPESEIR